MMKDFSNVGIPNIHLHPHFLQINQLLEHVSQLESASFKYVVIIFFIMTTLAENFGIFATSVSSKNVRFPRAYYTYIFSITKSTEPAVTSVNIIQVTESYGKPIMIGPKAK